MKLSLRVKTITGIASIAALLLLVLIVTVFQLLNDLVDSNVKKSADTTVALFVSTTKNAFLSYDLAALDADVSEILTTPILRMSKLRTSWIEFSLKKAAPKPWAAVSLPIQASQKPMTAFTILVRLSW